MTLSIQSYNYLFWQYFFHVGVLRLVLFTIFPKAYVNRKSVSRSFYIIIRYFYNGQSGFYVNCKFCRLSVKYLKAYKKTALQFHIYDLLVLKKANYLYLFNGTEDYCLDFEG